jgi:hypothetical protein
MRRLFARRPKPAMVVAFIALVAALSGTAVALPGKNTVDSGDIKKGAVKSGDIARGAVTNSKVRNGTLTGGKLRNGTITGLKVGGDTLTGANINESTLGQVPSANTANTANSANTANTANNIAPPEAFREVGAPGQPGFQNGCSNAGDPFETAGFYKDREGVVHLKGAISCPTNDIAFQLPEGYRPATGKFHATLQASDATDGDSIIVVAGPGLGPGTEGAVLSAFDGATVFLIDNISFRAVN